MLKRRLPPARRFSETHKLHWKGFAYFITIGYYEDHITPCEAFCSSTKQGTALELVAYDACILISYLLQVGADIHEIADMVGRVELNHPSEDPNDYRASIAGVICDLLLMEMAGKLMAQETPAEEAAKEETKPEVSDEVPLDRTPKRGMSVAQGYTGDTCTSCHNLTMRRNGACLVCDTCGTTTGCS